MAAVEAPLSEVMPAAFADEDGVAKKEQDDSNPASLTWKSLTVTTKKGRVLLQGVSGQIKGHFWAVMGPSGSGKSTLLNTLAMRLDRGVTLEGEMRLNGRPYTNADLKKLGGYVMQDDLLNANLTVEETLRYCAKLRCPQDATEEDRQRRIEAVMKQIGLAHARNVIVGSPLKKGISGGERKRLCVAQELLTEPRLLFLDEPTSGLDSVTALSLCTSLKELTSTCTIVCTIHQPQSKIFHLFDNLLLLKAGVIVYQGAANKAVEYFESSGFPCPAQTNPADHLLDTIAGERSDSTHSLVDIRRMRLSSVDLHYGADKNPLPLRETTPWMKQYMILLHRGIKEQSRKTNVIFTQLSQTVLMAVLIGTVFLQIGTSQESIVKRQPVLFFVCINQGVFGSLAVINAFPGERLLTLRERAAGTYYASAYFMAKITAETIFQLPMPVIFSIVVYFLIGLQAVATKFFIFMGMMCLCSVSATSLALMVSAICRTTDLSVTVLPMCLEVCRLFGGFFLSPRDLPHYFVWLDALSYVKYSFIAVSLNENRGLELTCTTAQQNSDGDCPVSSGNQILEAKGMAAYSIGECCGILVAYILVCRFFAYLGIRFIKW